MHKVGLVQQTVKQGLVRVKLLVRYRCPTYNASKAAGQTPVYRIWQCGFSGIAVGTLMWFFFDEISSANHKHLDVHAIEA